MSKRTTKKRSLRAYGEAEVLIAAADGGTIRERWLYGHRVLGDPSLMSSPASLRHGAAEDLIEAARTAGRKLNEREIRNRIQCARVYPTEEQIGRSTSDFECWTDLVEARFPRLVNPPDGGTPPDLRSIAERRRAQARNMLPLHPEQGSLFGEEHWSLPIAEMRRHADSQLDLAGRLHGRARDRVDLVDALSAAVGGDELVIGSVAAAVLGAQLADEATGR